MSDKRIEAAMNGDEEFVTQNFERSLSLVLADKTSISQILTKHSIAWARCSLQRLPVRITLGNLGLITVLLAILMPRVITYCLIYPIFRLVFGTLYPAYASYKAVRTKNVKEYVKWMMYWIVFALFTCAETFTDVFFSFWFPFYYEIKIILVLWLLSPATKGSSILYRRFVHPALIRREAEIDEALARATEQGYTAVLHLGTKGVNYATSVLMQTAIKNLPILAAINDNHYVSPISSSANPKEARTTKDCPDAAETSSAMTSDQFVEDFQQQTMEYHAYNEEFQVRTPSSDDDNDDFNFENVLPDQGFPTRKQKSRACKYKPTYEHTAYESSSDE